LVALLTVFAVLAGPGLWLSVIDPERHADGAGPLASLRGISKIGMSAPSSSGTPITFGLELCLSGGDDRVVVESIGPTMPVGSGVTFLGGRIRTLDLTTGTPEEQMAVGSVEGFPPPSIAPDTLVEAVGATVTHRCEPEMPKAYTELLVGFQGGPGVSGGWHGIDVAYRAGWRHRVVSLSYDLLLCGSASSDCADELIP
jgi:hypothetical protein